MHVPLFYKPKSVFGLDIGQRTIKFAQIKGSKGRVRVLGYGESSFDPSARQNGEIVKPEIIAAVIKPLLDKPIGKITTNRVVLSMPIAQAYTRIMNIPKMANKDLGEAVRLEADQYIPVPSEQLYLEHRVISTTKNPKDQKETISLLVVAVSKKIIDSYMYLCESLGLEVAGIEPNMFSNLRAVHFNCPQNVPKIVIDFGAHSSDLAIYDNTVRLTSTVGTGGENITDLIAKGLNISGEEAHRIKIRYGISKSKWQIQLASVLQPILSDFTNEVQKTMHYYHEQSGGKSITDIFMVGGGANMPGLSDFLSHLTGVRVQICNPWSNLSIKPLPPPHPSDTTVYNTAIGLALKEVNPDD